MLEMSTEKRPANDMFQDGLNLHAFAKAALANQLDKIMDPILVREQQEFQINRNISSINKRNLKESFISIIKIGVICSSKFSMDRMDITAIMTMRQRIRNKLL